MVPPLTGDSDRLFRPTACGSCYRTYTEHQYHRVGRNARLACCSEAESSLPRSRSTAGVAARCLSSLRARTSEPLSVIPRKRGSRRGLTGRDSRFRGNDVEEMAELSSAPGLGGIAASRCRGASPFTRSAVSARLAAPRSAGCAGRTQEHAQPDPPSSSARAPATPLPTGHGCGPVRSACSDLGQLAELLMQLEHEPVGVAGQAVRLAVSQRRLSNRSLRLSSTAALGWGFVPDKVPGAVALSMGLDRDGTVSAGARRRQAVERAAC